MFLKFFEIFYNKQGRWLQIFAAGVTKFWPCDEIRRFDGMSFAVVEKIIDLSFLSFHSKYCIRLSFMFKVLVFLSRIFWRIPNPWLSKCSYMHISVIKCPFCTEPVHAPAYYQLFPCIFCPVFAKKLPLPFKFTMLYSYIYWPNEEVQGERNV